MAYVTTTSASLAALIVTALKVNGATGAGQNVFAPRDWPSPIPLEPVLLVQSPRERKDSLGANAPQFDVHSTVRIVGRVTAKQQVNDAGAAAILAALSVLQRQVEVAVINYYDLFLVISEIETVETSLEVRSEGAVAVGEMTMDVTMKFYQGPEDFAQPTLTALEELAVYADLINVADPHGTYVPPFPYDVTPPPRTHGPDGRVEGKTLIELPQ